MFVVVVLVMMMIGSSFTRLMNTPFAKALPRASSLYMDCVHAVAPRHPEICGVSVTFSVFSKCFRVITGSAGTVSHPIWWFVWSGRLLEL